MAKKVTGRTCIFCGAKADSKEHIFPDWINQLILTTDFEGMAFTIERGKLIEQRTHRACKAAHVSARIVCGDCNHGWMSNLEGAARPLLGPLMVGEQTRLTTEQQLLAAHWAVKTAMVGEAIQYHRNSFSQEDRDIVRGQGRPPLRARVSIAAYAMDEPFATQYSRGLGKVLRNGTPFLDFYSHTIQVLHLVFSVRGTDTFAAADNRVLETIAEPRYMEIPLFPSVERCAWPPNLVMDHASLLEYSGAHNLELP
jgi:hypothetical protein